MSKAKKSMLKPSEKIAALIDQLNDFDDEVYNEEIRDNVQAAYGHLSDVQEDLVEVGL